MIAWNTQKAGAVHFRHLLPSIHVILHVCTNTISLDIRPHPQQASHTYHCKRALGMHMFFSFISALSLVLAIFEFEVSTVEFV